MDFSRMHPLTVFGTVLQGVRNWRRFRQRSQTEQAWELARAMSVLINTAVSARPVLPTAEGPYAGYVPNEPPTPRTRVQHVVRAVGAVLMGAEGWHQLTSARSCYQRDLRERTTGVQRAPDAGSGVIALLAALTQSVASLLSAYRWRARLATSEEVSRWERLYVDRLQPYHAIALVGLDWLIPRLGAVGRPRLWPRRPIGVLGLSFGLRAITEVLAATESQAAFERRRANWERSIERVGACRVGSGQPSKTTWWQWPLFLVFGILFLPLIGLVAFLAEIGPYLTASDLWHSRWMTALRARLQR